MSVTVKGGVRTFTLTMSEQDAALVFYLVGASCSYGTRVFQDLLPHFRDVDALRHTHISKPGIDLARVTELALNKLSNKVSA